MRPAQSRWQSRWMGSWTAVLAVTAAVAVGAGEAAADLKRPCQGRRCPLTTKISGTAYTFNVGSPIVGAEIRIDELPSLGTTTDENGYWEMVVPVGANVTPYIAAAGYDTIHLQTFRTTRAPLEQVNFQTPTEGVYQLLYVLLEFMIGGPPLADGCVIVSTISDPAVVGMTFDEFVHFAPHGVEGASASGFPAMPAPIYFNEFVIPDLAQQLSSNDGGVLWANVPPGVYQVSATHPEVEFASFTATCVQGRVINANPPWGLHGIP